MDRKWWTLIAVCIGTFMLLLDVTIVNVALPSMQRALHASFSDLQWVVDAYALTLAALLLTTGVVGRSVRPPTGVHDRPRDLHPELARVGLGHEPAVAEPRPRRPGDRRRGDVLDFAGVARKRLSGP